MALKVVVVSNCLSKSSKDYILNKEYEEEAIMEYLSYCYFLLVFYKNSLIFKESNRRLFMRDKLTLFSSVLKRVKGNDLRGIILVI